MTLPKPFTFRNKSRIEAVYQDLIIGRKPTERDYRYFVDSFSWSKSVSEGGDVDEKWEYWYSRKYNRHLLSKQDISYIGMIWKFQPPEVDIEDVL